MPATQWTDIGRAEELKVKPLQQVMCGRTLIALTYKDETFTAISGICNHVGGPLGEGTLEGDYVVCPCKLRRLHHEAEIVSMNASHGKGSSAFCAAQMLKGLSEDQ